MIDDDDDEDNGGVRFSGLPSRVSINSDFPSLEAPQNEAGGEQQ